MRYRESIEKTIRLQSGHLQIQALSYDQDKTSLLWEDLIEDPDRIAGMVSSLPDVLLATPRLVASGIVSSGDVSKGVQIIGIDPLSEASAPFRDGIIDGRFITPDDRDGLLIGKTLADKLNLKAGDTTLLLANTSNGDVNEQTFTIRGIFTTHTPRF